MGAVPYAIYESHWLEDLDGEFLPASITRLDRTLDHLLEAAMMYQPALARAYGTVRSSRRHAAYPAAPSPEDFLQEVTQVLSKVLREQYRSSCFLAASSHKSGGSLGGRWYWILGYNRKTDMISFMDDINTADTCSADLFDVTREELEFRFPQGPSLAGDSKK